MTSKLPSCTRKLRFSFENNLGRTDRRTDGRTDTTSYRDAWSHLKMRHGMTFRQKDGRQYASFQYRVRHVGPRGSIRCDYLVVTHFSIVDYIIWRLKIHNFCLLKITWDRRTDRRTDRQTNKCILILSEAIREYVRLSVGRLVRPSVRCSHTNWIFEKSDVSSKMEQNSSYGFLFTFIDVTTHLFKRSCLSIGS